MAIGGVVIGGAAIGGVLGGSGILLDHQCRHEDGAVVGGSCFLPKVSLDCCIIGGKRMLLYCS